MHLLPWRSDRRDAAVRLSGESGADCISIDSRTKLSEAEKVLGDGIAIQGNFDPTERFSEPEKVKETLPTM